MSPIKAHFPRLFLSSWANLVEIQQLCQKYDLSFFFIISKASHLFRQRPLEIWEGGGEELAKKSLLPTLCTRVVCFWPRSDLYNMGIIWLFLKMKKLLLQNARKNVCFVGNLLSPSLRYQMPAHQKKIKHETCIAFWVGSYITKTYADCRQIHKLFISDSDCTGIFDVILWH